MAENVPGSRSLPFEPTEEILFQPITKANVESKITQTNIAVLYKDTATQNHMIAIEKYDIRGITKTKNHYIIERQQDGKYLTEATSELRSVVIGTDEDEQDIRGLKEYNEPYTHLANLLLKLQDKSIEHILVGDITQLGTKVDLKNIIKLYNLPHTHEYGTAKSSCHDHEDSDYCYLCGKFRCCILVAEAAAEAEAILKLNFNDLPKKILYTVNGLYYIGELSGSNFTSTQINDGDMITGSIIIRASTNDNPILHWKNLKQPMTYKTVEGRLVTNKTVAIDLTSKKDISASVPAAKNKYLKYKQKYLQLKKQLKL